ncbi:MAG: hypothetical protein ACK46X_13420 [Candidatus Sericytochromatia bacterium]
MMNRSTCLLALLVGLAGCTPAPGGTTATTGASPSPGASASPSSPVAMPTSPVASTGPAAIRVTFKGVQAVYDGQAAPIGELTDRVPTGNAVLVTVGAVQKPTLAVGDYQLQLSVEGKARNPQAAGFTNDELKAVGWTLWVGDGRFVPNKMIAVDGAEIQTTTVQDGKLTMRYKGKIKPMIGTGEHTLDLTVTDLPLN